MNELTLLQFPSDAELASAAAREFIRFATSPGTPTGPRTVALSGGRIARGFCTALAHLAPAESPGLGSVHFFWGDERCVPPTDPESNFALANQHLLQPLGIPAGRIHRIRGELPPPAAAAEAERELREILASPNGTVPRIDLVILGMGEDGHVASLFPGDPVADTATSPLFRPVVASKPPPNRITASYTLIREAREVWVLASGAGKAPALAQSLLTTETPLGNVRATRTRVRVFTDIPQLAAAVTTR